jgi:glycosyltransferase involved in cell wall biosynthesis
MALRVCLVTEIFHPEDQGGQGQQAFELARRIRARGVGVIVATRRNFSGSAAREALDGVEVVRLPPTGLFKGRGWAAVLPTLLFLAGLFAYLVRMHRRYDLILVQGAKAILVPVALAGRILGKPCIIKIDALAELEQDLTPESLASMGLRESAGIVRLWAQLRAGLLQRAAAIVAISAQLDAALAARGVASARLVRIPNGLDFKRWTSSSRPRSDLRSELALPCGVLVIYTGRLARAKGVLMLLEAWEQVAPRYPDAHLVIVGGGDRSFDGCEMELRERVRRRRLEHCVTLTGHVDNVPDYLSASDLFVQCSESEGFGLSLVEAMAAGLPCISTRVGVAIEIIEHQVSGWLIPGRDVQALIAVLDESLGSRMSWPAIGGAARQAVVTRFDLDEVAARYVELLERLAPRVSTVQLRWRLAKPQPGSTPES